MTTADLLAALAKECPNGVSFNPMAVRLLKRKLSFEDLQVRNLQANMFQLENGLWFSIEMISNDDTRLALRGQARTWLMEHGYFSVEQLFNNFYSVLSNLTTPEDFATFLRHLGFTVVEGKKGDLFCLHSSTSLDECLMKTSRAISKQLDEVGGTLIFNEIAMAMPHLTTEALENIRTQFLLVVYAVEVGGVPCWCSTEAIPLPEDFSEQLTTIVDTLIVLDEKVSIAKLEFALNLFYRTRFRKEYALLDKNTFMRVCAKYYRGGNDVFLNETKFHMGVNDWSMSGKRQRRPNTQFRNLGISVGAKLVYTIDPQISCIVLDEINQVEFAGKAWSISALAIHLLGVSSVNGFCYFSYDGEVLWDRRSRLERADKHIEYQVTETPFAKVRKTEREIIGLKGRALSPMTWRAFRSAGISSRVAEWARRIADGESVAKIARECGIAAVTVKLCVANRRRYFDVCYKNGIVPEGGRDV